MSFWWNREKVRILISMFKERSSLWDSTHPDYSNREIKNDHLVSIGKVIGCDAKEVSGKIRKLKLQFQGEVRKIKSKRRGQESEKNYFSKWEYFQDLKFIEKAFASMPTPTKSNLNLEDSNNFILKSSPSLINSPPKESSPSLVSLPLPLTTRSSPPRKRYRKKHTHTSTEVEPRVPEKVISSIDPLNSSKTTEDEWSSIGSIATYALRGMKSNVLREELGHKLVSLVFEYKAKDRTSTAS